MGRVISDLPSFSETVADGDLLVCHNVSKAVNTRDEKLTVEKLLTDALQEKAITARGIKPASDSTTAIQLQNAAGTAILTVDTTNSVVVTKTMRGGAFTIAAHTGAGTATLPIASGSHGLLFLYSSSAGSSAVYHISNSATLLSGSSSTFKTSGDTTSTSPILNVYTSGGNIILQNGRTTGTHSGTYFIIAG